MSQIAQAQTSPTTSPAGFFGKLVSHGDFVSRRLPASFMQVWDIWLQHGIHASRETLGNTWLETYLTSPVWRFVLNTGVANELPWAGVLMPSVDRVGRHFPLTIAASASGKVAMLKWLKDEKTWFDDLEVLALSSLENNFSMDDFDLALQKKSGLAGPVVLGSGARDKHSGWCFGLNNIDDIAANIVPITADIADALLAGHSLWWTEGSPHVSPSVLVCSGLPSPSQFTAMLDGSWHQSGWQTPEVIL